MRSVLNVANPKVIRRLDTFYVASETTSIVTPWPLARERRHHRIL